MIDPQIAGKTALVTGANHGIGAAIAKTLAYQGVRVFITYKRIDDMTSASPDSDYVKHRAQDATAVVSEIHAEGGQCEAVEADLSLPETVPALFDQAEAAFGAVDILVNNAAHWQPGTFVPADQALANNFSISWMDEPVGVLDAVMHDGAFAVNARGTALMMVEFARRHVGRNDTWGRIINISTDTARSFPSEAAYGASKYAMESYSRAAASELGQFGITVNIISAGPIQTGYITPEMDAAISQHTPMRRVGLPQDVADAVLLMVAEQARWITGQLIHVGGGHRM